MIQGMSPACQSWKDYKDYVRIHPTAIIAPSASIKIFNPPKPAQICLEIGEGSHIFSSFSLLRPQAKIQIGKRCQLGASQFICADSIEVGDDVLMAWGGTIMDNDSHPLDWEFRKNDVIQCYNDYRADPADFIKNKDWSHVSIAPIKIQSRTWIGFNTAILKGITIGNNAVVAACSVVVKNVDPFTVVAGNPASAVSRLRETDGTR
jgi:acetyltransferase-like isoleucine patch superfamily enzyme